MALKMFTMTVGITMFTAFEFTVTTQLHMRCVIRTAKERTEQKKTDGKQKKHQFIHDSMNVGAIFVKFISKHRHLRGEQSFGSIGNFRKVEVREKARKASERALLWKLEHQQ